MRVSGDVKIMSSGYDARCLATAFACFFPVALRGISVTPINFLCRFHLVSPCRIRINVVVIRPDYIVVQ
mgnify:CR=1 FL=1